MEDFTKLEVEHLLDEVDLDEVDLDEVDRPIQIKEPARRSEVKALK